MKKLISIAAIAAILFTACGKTEKAKTELVIAVLSGESVAVSCAEKLNLPYSIVYCENDDEMLEMLNIGTADFAAASPQKTNTIGTDFLLSVPYSYKNICAVYTGDYKYLLADFNEETTGVSKALSGLNSLDSFKVYDEDEAEKALEKGEINAYLCFPDSAESVADNGDFKANNVADISAEQFVFVLNRNSSNLKASLDSAIYSLD